MATAIVVERKAENRLPPPARFFMAEDNPGDVELMRTAIEVIGLDAVVEVAVDGAAAVKCLLDPGHQLPDIIILNFNLPKMQGHEVLTEIKHAEHLLGVPVVMLTSSDAQQDHLICNTADAYFVKSGNFEGLVAIVRHLRDLIDAHPCQRPTTESKLSNDPFWRQGAMGPQGTHEHPIADLELPRGSAHGIATAPPQVKIVCLGSSAGGLEALIAFFRSMVPDSGLGFVVIQHLLADTEPLTPDILSRVTSMPVSQAREGELVLPNHVYTMSPGTKLTVVAGRLRVALRTETPVRNKPFDGFLNSLALDLHERAIAVIFSGYDGDGSEGFIAIKANGGSTYAQDQTAQVDQMPRHAMATGCVDTVLDPGHIADLISQRR